MYKDREFSSALEEIVDGLVDEGIDPDIRKRIYKIIITVFEGYDLDVIQDINANDKVFDEVVEELGEDDDDEELIYDDE